MQEEPNLMNPVQALEVINREAILRVEATKGTHVLLEQAYASLRVFIAQATAPAADAKDAPDDGSDGPDRGSEEEGK